MTWKSLFVAEEQHNEIKPTTVAPPPVATITSTFPSSAPAAVDQQAFQKLQATITQQAPQSLKQLEENLSTLSDTIPDETMRFKAAVKLLSKSGISLETLSADYDKCSEILNNAKNAFDATVQKQTAIRVEERQNQITQLTQSIQSKQEQIAQLNTDIANINQQISTIRTDITTDQLKMLL